MFGTPNYTQLGSRGDTRKTASYVAVKEVVISGRRNSGDRAPKKKSIDLKNIISNFSHRIKAKYQSAIKVLTTGHTIIELKKVIPPRS